MPIGRETVDNVLFTLCHFLTVHFQKVGMRAQPDKAVNLVAELMVKHGF